MNAEVRQTLDGVVSHIGGAHREGQQRMAEIVWEALASTQHALIEAGTGTGKSLAYLVPAVMRAVTSGERVVISTATLALQRQILTKDAPVVVEAVAKGRREPSLALLKGWNNYVCLHKLSGGYPQETLFDPDPGAVETQNGGTSELAEEILRLRTFAEESETGDRDDLEG
ncbi:MAG TPA: DEAD/DEAH box helicase, partial [Beutenbergiaceae bacterium]|nr:DEAD/DEAH box helicase [Beutenbergiaceae bacterium]